MVFTKKRKAREMTSERRPPDCRIKMETMQLCIPQCSLGRANANKPMLSCGLCDRWYHFECLSLFTDTPQSQRSLYLCDHCRSTFRQRGTRLEALEAAVTDLKKRLDQAPNAVGVPRSAVPVPKSAAVSETAARLAASEAAAQSTRSAYAVLLRENEELKDRLLERKQARRERKRQRRERHEYLKSLAETQRRIRVEMGLQNENPIDNAAESPEASNTNDSTETEWTVQPMEENITTGRRGRRQKKTVVAEDVEENARLSLTTIRRGTVTKVRRGRWNKLANADAENTQLHVTTAPGTKMKVRRGRWNKLSNVDDKNATDDTHVPVTTAAGTGNKVRRSRWNKLANAVAENATDAENTQLQVTTAPGTKMKARRGRWNKLSNADTKNATDDTQLQVTAAAGTEKKQRGPKKLANAKVITENTPLQVATAGIVKKRGRPRLLDTLAPSSSGTLSKVNVKGLVGHRWVTSKKAKVTKTNGGLRQQKKDEIATTTVGQLFKCKRCTETFVNRKELLSHAYWCCHSCGITFSSAATMKNHRRTCGIVDPPVEQNLPMVVDEEFVDPEQATYADEPEPMVTDAADDMPSNGLYDKAIVVDPDSTIERETDAHDDIVWAPIHLMHVTMEPDTIVLD